MTTFDIKSKATFDIKSKATFDIKSKATFDIESKALFDRVCRDIDFNKSPPLYGLVVCLICYRNYRAEGHSIFGAGAYARSCGASQLKDGRRFWCD